MKVIQHIEKAQGKPLFSFEILPPLKGQNIQSIFDSIDPLMEFDPPFIEKSTNTKNCPADCCKRKL
jgi:methylenetetrahydrofolate reductase (NADPH)